MLTYGPSASAAKSVGLGYHPKGGRESAHAGFAGPANRSGTPGEGKGAGLQRLGPTGWVRPSRLKAKE